MFSPTVQREIGMKNILVSIVVFFGSSFVVNAFAQVGQLLPPEIRGNYLYPANPTSADTIRVDVYRFYNCGGSATGTGFTPGNLYRMAMVQNSITVALSNNSGNSLPLPGCFPRSPDAIELGRFPPGTYILNIVEPAISGFAANILVSNYQFTVTDARASKASPWVRLDYSGHWWDPADSGWGLFIWQDAKSPADSILAAWFTYATDGTSQWYVFQPTWQTHSATTTASILFTRRGPGPTSPPPGNTANNQPFITVGTASLDFDEAGAAGVGKITYKFGDGPTLVRTIRRFVP